MNTLLEKNVISELQCGSNFSYILSDNNDFLPTEYKVLQSQANSCFVKCMKMLYNGHVQLYYLTSGLKSFASMLPLMDPESFLTITANLLSDIVDVKHNGFLSCRNIDISFDRIYIDPATYKVSLVYLPMSKRIFEDNASFENEIRTGLVRLICGVSSITSPKTMRLSADLSNGTLRMEDLCAHIKSGKSANTIHKGVIPTPNTSPVPPHPKAPALRLVAMNAPTRVEIVVTKDGFVIGKKAELCDAVIDYNKMISRAHCQIGRKGNLYTITDLQSANGTFVNKIKLPPNKPHPIKNGDVVRLANSDFQIIIR